MSDTKLPFLMKRVPWGFREGKDGYLVSTTSSAERWHRGAVGEAAIRVCLALGLSLELLEELLDVEDPAAIVAALQARRQ